MSEPSNTEKPLRERVKDRLRDFIGDLAEVLGGMLLPEPQPVRIPIRRQNRR
jgi:hypothetical protein